VIAARSLAANVILYSVSLLVLPHNKIKKIGEFMEEQKEYSVVREIGIVFSIGFSLGMSLLIVGLLIIEFLKG
jgi:hypothetical protein